MLQTHAHVRFGSKADICSAKEHVRFTPESGHVRCKTLMSALCQKRTSGHLFDHFVGALLQLQGQVDAESLSGPQVDDQFVLDRRLHGKLAGICTL